MFVQFSFKLLEERIFRFEIFLGADPEKWLPSGEAKLTSLIYNFFVSIIIVLLPIFT